MKIRIITKHLAIALITCLISASMLPVSAQANDLISSSVYTDPLRQLPSGSSPVSAGGLHGLSLHNNGTVFAWGDNSEGQLGTGSSEPQKNATPGRVNGLNDVKEVSAGMAHSLALKQDGTVWAWGNNEFGQAGITTVVDLAGVKEVQVPEDKKRIFMPEQVQGLSDVTSISAGMDYSLALKADGTVWAWGNDEHAQLGNNSVMGISGTPVKVNISNVIKISAGSAFAVALKNDGTVWTWGGLLVDREGVHNATNDPQPVYELSDVVGISAGFSHSLALKNDGTVWGWGSNDLFQIGADRSQSSWEDSWNKAMPIKGFTGVSSIAAGTYLSLALKSNGTVWAVGVNLWGQLGDGQDPNQEPVAPYAVQVKEMERVTAISSGLGFNLARQAPGNIWGWGANQQGQLGNKTYGGPILTGESGDPSEEQISGVNAPVQASVFLGPESASYFGRLAGNEATQTSVEISKAGWFDGASTVVLATVLNFPDALAGATLAHQFDAPILLTERDSLTPEVKNEITRLNPTRIIIVGGTAVVSKEIQNVLNQKYQVTRLAGNDQYETAYKIASYLHEVNPQISGKAVIAYGENYPDALSISSWAAYHGIPILLTKTKELPQSTKDALSELGVKETIIVGGRAVVSDVVAAQLPNVTRFSGNDEYQTSIAVARGLGLNVRRIFLATGENFPDALAGAAFAAKTGSPIILLDKEMQKAVVTNFLSDNSARAKQTYILGGTAVISPKVYENLSWLIP